MKNLIFFFGLTFLNFYIELRKIFWKIRKNISNTITLRLTDRDKITILTKGEIAAILYANQPKVFFNKGWEHRTINLMKQQVHEGMIVLDIGANIGMYSILLSKLVGSYGRVYAFEPDSSTFNILTQNLSLSKCENVFPFKIAISDSNSFVKMTKPTDQSGDAFHFIQPTSDFGDSSNIVQTITLDQFLLEQNIPQVDFIKIDIEGAELLCLIGARNLISGPKSPVLVCECYEEFLQRFGKRISDVLIYMDSKGYTCDNYDDYQWIFYKK